MARSRRPGSRGRGGARRRRPEQATTAGNFRALVLACDVPVLVDFHADWCAPCKPAQARLMRLAAELGDRIRIVQVDADRARGLLERHRVATLPTWLLFQSGREVARGVGPGRLDRIERRLRELSK